jgi:kynurenine formamidase
MKTKTFVIGCGLALALLLFAERRSSSQQASGLPRAIDLTHPAGSISPGFGEDQGNSAVRLQNVSQAENTGPLASTVAEHFATNIDAPAHFVPGLWTVEQIPAERLTAPLVVMDVRRKAARDPDYRVTVDDIGDWEQVNGQIPQSAVVFALTGWETRWESARDYRNPDAGGVMHFPGFSPESARFLVEGRNIIGLGIDTLSVDYGASRTLPVHQYTAAHSVYHLENVANLDRAPAAGGMVVVAPMRMAGGSGGPVRLRALARQEL